jgi:predicted ATP-dependent endonuclease of OLD family
MEIKRLKIEKLHGYIDKDIKFNSDLTLLVGINGAGKTSILNVINWIVRPSLPHLCITEFKIITLWFSLKNKDYEIVCKHNKSTFHYTVKTKGEDYSPLIVRLGKHPKDIQNDESLRSNLLEGYKGLGPDAKEKNTWELISSFPAPTIIGLDRNIYTEESEDAVYFDEDQRTRARRKKPGNSKSPVERVKEIINVEYRKRKNRVLNLTNSLKNHLMISAFDGSITLESLSAGIRYKLNLAQIEKAESRVNEYFKNIEQNILTPKESQTITNYFSQLKVITKKYQSNPNDESVKLLYGLNANQFVKIRNLLKEFEKFESLSVKAMDEIQTYLDTLNHFFKDSAKKILFKEDTSEITFNNLDKNGSAVTKYKDIKFLSSGEQQILILFTYIAFNSTDGKVFIIDEPELSLHIKWQEDFLEKLERITPDSTQLLLATHSPILANKKRDKAITLLPYNV